MPGTAKGRFATFGGVFTPSILTILGVILFMRAGFVVGEAGILGAILILVIATSITLTTSLSIGAVSTNMRVGGGGAYYIISRVLGPAFGGAIGIALFFALALSVPFYILGFTEALVRIFPDLVPHFGLITISTATVLFVVAFVGAHWALRLQFVIMGCLALSIAAFLLGAAFAFSPETLQANLASKYTPLTPHEPLSQRFSFWLIFAIYFPAVTGIDAGLNMSGDLKNPAKSIPRGTLLAVGVGFAVYLTQIVLCGSAFSRDELLTRPFQSLVDHAAFGLGPLVVAGVFAATLSSALGSLLGAPRVLQAVARDPIIGLTRPFGKGAGASDEPRRALIVSGILTFAVLLLVGNQSGGGPLNAMAAVISMFFLYSYGMINLAAFVEDYGDNPSFRPTFKFYHWSVALAGALGCAAAAFLINWAAAVIALLLVSILYRYLRSRVHEAGFPDARRGFVFNSARNSLLQLSQMRSDPKNWRPLMLLFAGDPKDRPGLVEFAARIEAGRGMLFVAAVLPGAYDRHGAMNATVRRRIADHCEELGIRAFPSTIVTPDLETGVAALIQCAGIGPFRPNVVAFGWRTGAETAAEYLRPLGLARQLGMSLLITRAPAMRDDLRSERIDVWWRGRKNGDLMILLASLMANRWDRTDVKVRVMRIVKDEAGREPAGAALRELIEATRTDAETCVLVSADSFGDILRRHSADASCVFLGFEMPEPGGEASWQERYEEFQRGLAAVVLVCSAEEVDAMA